MTGKVVAAERTAQARVGARGGCPPETLMGEKPKWRMPERKLPRGGG